MNGSAARLHASGCSVVDLTNNTLASMQKAFNNREAPIGEVTNSYNHSGHLAVTTTPCKELHGRYRNVRVLQYRI